MPLERGFCYRPSVNAPGIRASWAPPSGSMAMTNVTLSATRKGNGFQATVTYSNGVSISSAEAFPTKAEAISAAAMKVLDMPDRLEEFDAPSVDD